MEEKELLDARKFLALITDPRIRAVIDLKKTAMSGQYRKAIDVGADHALKHGDFNLLNKLLALMDGTPHAGEFVAYLRPKLNFVITPTKPRTLKKATPKLVAQVAKEAADIPVTPRKIAVPEVPKKKTVRLDKKIDLMDTHLRLPGSFGSGKRR
jgi:hypothetical protein